MLGLAALVPVDIAGEGHGHGRSDTETTGPDSAAASRSSDADAARSTDARRPHRRDHPHRSIVTETPHLMLDRGRRHARLDQLYPAAVHDLVPGRCGDSHGQAEMTSDPYPHTPRVPRARRGGEQASTIPFAGGFAI